MVPAFAGTNGSGRFASNGICCCELPAENLQECEMKAQYIRAMDAIHQACLFVAGSCLVIITIIIPYGVFTRYALHSAASWPEPIAVLLMIVLSFLSAVVCYREYLHIGVGVIPGLLPESIKPVLGWFLELCMLLTNLFMLWRGIKLAESTWYQSIAEFPILSAGMAYLPIRSEERRVGTEW